MHTLCIRGLVLFFISTTLCALSEKEALTQELFNKRCEISNLGLMIKERSNLLRTYMKDMAALFEDLLDNKAEGKTTGERAAINKKIRKDFTESVKRINKNYGKKDYFKDIALTELFDVDENVDMDCFNHVNFHWIYCRLEREFLKQLAVMYEKAVQDSLVLVNKLEELHA